MHSVYLLSVLVCAVNALHNVTLDDNDPQIVYNPPQSWVTSANSSLDAGGAHKLTQDPTATAKLVFTGVAIYFLSPRWPYNVNTQVSLDSGTPVLIDLVDHSVPGVLEGPETAPSQVVWNATGLANIQHTLLISVGQGQPYGIVDTLIYTALDPSDVSSTSSIPSSSLSSTLPSTTHASTSSTNGQGHTSSTSNPDQSGSSSSNHVLPIILGTVLGVAALSIIIAGLFFCSRRRKRPTSEAWSVAGTSNPALDTAAMSTSPLGPYPDHYQNNQNWYTPSHPYTNDTFSPFPGAMAPANAAALARPYSDSGDQNHWQGTTGQMTERFNNRTPNRYQPSQLSTIAETSPQPTVTPLANSPASQDAELRDTQMPAASSANAPNASDGPQSSGYPTSIEGRWNGHPYSRRPPAYAD